jgi:hypothetical protein
MREAIWRGWRVFAGKIGHVQSQLLLTLIYFVVLGPFALAVRLFSDPLHLRRAASWQPVPTDGRSSATLDSLRQQF